MTLHREEAFQALQALYHSTAPRSRMVAIEAIAEFGEPSSAFLQCVMSSTGEFGIRAQAAKCYLEAHQARTPAVAQALREEVPDLLFPKQKFKADVLYSFTQSGDAYSQLIGNYYINFGTREDIPLLETFADCLVFDRGIPVNWVSAYKRKMSAECLRARDYIVLQSQR